ncbi:hypothetical protein [Streptomyces sp. NPDC101150]|uniref:hypothetical protein n=1 Tax=Streptomyces sp. NPDC101150 TaxID=3366114 RepID=UPI0038029858
MPDDETLVEPAESAASEKSFETHASDIKRFTRGFVEAVRSGDTQATDSARIDLSRLMMESLELVQNVADAMASAADAPAGASGGPATGSGPAPGSGG